MKMSETNNKTIKINYATRTFNPSEGTIGFTSEKEIKIKENQENTYSDSDSKLTYTYENDKCGIPIYLNGQYQTISYLNNKETIDAIEEIRGKSRSNENTPIFVHDNVSMESIPDDLDIKELHENIFRQQAYDEYSEKVNYIKKMKELFNDFSGGTWKCGVANDDNKIKSIDGHSNHYPAHPSIKVENCDESTQLYLFVRGVRIAMDKFETTKNSDVFNFIFRYPKFLLNDYENNYNAIDGVEIVGNTNNNISLYAISSTTFGDNNAETADNTKQYGINTLV